MGLDYMINSQAIKYTSCKHLQQSWYQRGGCFWSLRSLLGWVQLAGGKPCTNSCNRATVEGLEWDHILEPIMSWWRLPWIFLFNGIWGIKNGFTNHFLIWRRKQGMKSTRLSSSSARQVVNKENKLEAGSHLIGYLTTCYQLITHL